MSYLKKKKLLYYSGTLAILIFMLFIGIKSSYAIPYEENELPYNGDTFSTNANASTGFSNYIKQAAGSNDDVYANFNVPTSLYTSDGSKPFYLMMKNLSTPLGDTEQIEVIDGDNPLNLSDKGILYILEHGYNPSDRANKFFSGVTDNNLKQYITQIALWLYIYEHKTTYTAYCANGACDFTVDASQVRNLITSAGNKSGYSSLKYITTLVDNANTYKNSGSYPASAMQEISNSDISFTINDDYTLLTTSLITPTAKTNTDKYLNYYYVEIEDPEGYGPYLIDENNEIIDNYSDEYIINKPFKVVVPLLDGEGISSMNLASIKVKIFGYFLTDQGYEYRVTYSDNGLVTTDGNKSQKYSNLLLGYAPTETKQTNFNLRNFTKISKVDVSRDNAELQGASLKISKIEASGKVEIETWVSTTTPHYVVLQSGNYELCETAAPRNYVLNTECVSFTVNDNNVTTVVMENSPEIPDTGSNKSLLISLFGVIFVVIGAAFTTFIVLTKKNSAV